MPSQTNSLEPRELAEKTELVLNHDQPMHDVIEVSSHTSSSPFMTGLDVIELTDDSEPEVIVKTTATGTTSKPPLSKKRKLVWVDSDTDEDGDNNSGHDFELLNVKFSPPAAPADGPSTSSRAVGKKPVSTAKKPVSKTKDVSAHKHTRLFVNSRAPSPSSRSSKIPRSSSFRSVGESPENQFFAPGVGSLELEPAPLADSNKSSDMGAAGKDKGKGKAKAVDDEGAAGMGQTNCLLVIRSPSPPPPHSATNSQFVPGSSRIPTNSLALSEPSSQSLPIVTTTASSTSALQPVPPPPPPPPPPPLLETPEEAMSRYTAQVLEIIPDVEPEHCAALVADRYPDARGATVERVLHSLFEDPSYPKIQKGPGQDKGKRKAVEEDEAGGRPRKRTKLAGKAQKGKEKQKGDDLEEEKWLSLERPFTGGRDYHELALNQLQQDFVFIPKQYLRIMLGSNKGLYAPTFFRLLGLEKGLEDTDERRRPYDPRKLPYKLPKGRGKGKQKALADDEFQRELAWVKRTVDIESGKQVVGDGDGDEVGFEDDDDDDDDEEENEESDVEDDEEGIECGCCFSRFRFEKMIQCPDAHLFCRSCLRSYASTLLGTHNPQIQCMSQSICQQTFPSSQLVAVLPRKTYALYERLLQAQEIAKANLEGLEECPFCEWKCVFDVGFDQEKLFRCDGCGGVSCRNCKKLDHLPKSCEEVEKDRKLDARHEVEEAMTKALMRNCPNCSKAFIKESGCNKMTCPNCSTVSCYICRKVITGYEHFNQSGRSSDKGKCILWDKDLEAMHATEVKKAAEEAFQKVKSLHPDVSDSDLKVDLPKSKQPVPPMPRLPFNHIFHRVAPHYFPAQPQVPQAQAPRRQVIQHRRGGGNPPPKRAGLFRHLLHQPQPLAPNAPNQHNANPFQHAPHHLPYQNPPLPPEPLRPYHEVVAQAMMGQYEPPGGGMEIGGRVLRTRAGRAAAAPPPAIAGGAGMRVEPVFHPPPQQGRPRANLQEAGGMFGAAPPPQWAMVEGLNVRQRAGQQQQQPVMGAQQHGQVAQWVVDQQQQVQQERLLAQQQLQGRVALQQPGKWDMRR